MNKGKTMKSLTVSKSRPGRESATHALVDYAILFTFCVTYLVTGNVQFLTMFCGYLGVTVALKAVRFYGG